MNREQRIEQLLSQMTLEEKASQLLHKSPPIDRLGIPGYNWWNEALHGVARAGVATIFPQAIALGASFDEDLVHRVATAISDEARAKFSDSVLHENRSQYRGLTMWSPNINIFRDPRWGRGQETYGEDPFLTTRIGLAFMKGLQGEDPEHLKTAACAKHFAVHSGPEAQRHSFDARVSEKDLRETYLPAFKALVDAGVEAVMGAYNRTQGEPCCASTLLMEDILRKEWGFQGHYVSDCWAIKDFHQDHGVTETPEESVALALNKGCDLNCGCTYDFLVKAVKEGLVGEDKIDQSLRRLLRTRFRLGMFDPPEMDPWSGIDLSVVASDDHKALSREAAVKSAVLLKNEGDLLPLDDSAKELLLIGPTAANLHTLMGNYHGYSTGLITLLEGITGKIENKPLINLQYHQGCLMYQENKNMGWTLGMAENADLVIAAFGLDSAMEGEEGDAIASSEKGDRSAIELPSWQMEYLRAMRKRGTPTVLVLTGGCPVAFPDDIADAILYTWYPGEQGGAAIADLLFGDAVPSGKLPVTFPKSTEQLPPYEDYSMKGRTYRYMEEDPLYPFGFGLSYCRFSLMEPNLSAEHISRGESLSLEVQLKNLGDRRAAETIQLYIRNNQRQSDDPICSLRAFQKKELDPGASVTLEFNISWRDFLAVNQKGEEEWIPGEYSLILANAAPVPSALEKGAMTPLVISCRVK